MTALIDHQTLAFVVVAALITISPGADTLLVLRNTLRGGRRDGVLSSLGVCTGLFVHAALSALGISAVLAHSAAVYELLRWLGAAYLAWLGLQSLRRAALSAPAPPTAGVPAGAVSGRRSFGEGFLTNLLNPKVALFYLAFLPQFVAPGDPVLAKSLFLAALHYAMGIAWLSGLALLVERAGIWLQRAGVRRAVDGACGLLLLGLGLRLVLERR